MLSYNLHRLKIKHLSMCLGLLFLSTSTTLDSALPKVYTLEKQRVEKFLRHTMIQDYGFYTLLGTKPMTAMNPIPVLDEDEKKDLLNELTEKHEKHISPKKYRPFKKEALQLWYAWEKVQSKYISEQFFFKFDPEWDSVFFVNIPTVTFIMDKYYEEFSEVFGKNFDPLEAVHLIGEIKEPQWKKLKKNHYLLGLLFGFGEVNANFFAREMDTKSHPLRRFSIKISGPIAKSIQILSVKDLDIPGFISYHLYDPVEEHFKKEREKIIALYEGRDFLELTLSYLGGNPPRPTRKKLSKEEEKLFRENIGYNSRIKSASPQP